jgi:hypothetical protein
MSRLLIYTIVFIEGFCSLGAEVIALTLSLQINQIYRNARLYNLDTMVIPYSQQYGVTNDTCLR